MSEKVLSLLTAILSSITKMESFKATGKSRKKTKSFGGKMCS